MFIHMLVLLVASAAISGNSLVCHTILHSKCVKKTAFNYLLFNLAILDVITSILAVYKTVVTGTFYQENNSGPIIRVYNQSHVGADIMCKIGYSFRLGLNTTPTFLLLIAYERYKAIVKPLSRGRSGQSSNGKLKLAIFLSWISGSIITVPSLVSKNVGNEGCKSTPLQWYSPVIYKTTVVSACFLIPTVITSVLYYKVAKAIKRNEQLGFQADAQIARERTRRKVIAIIITVTVLFYIFCGIPQLVYVTRELSGWRPWEGLVQVLLYSINSLANPLIYFTFLKTFRTGLKSIFKCGRENNAMLYAATSQSVASHENVISKDDKHIELLTIKELSKR